MTRHVVDIRGRDETLRTVCVCGWTASGLTREEVWAAAWRHRLEATGAMPRKCAKCGKKRPMPDADICEDCDFDPFPEDDFFGERGDR